MIVLVGRSDKIDSVSFRVWKRKRASLGNHDINIQDSMTAKELSAALLHVKDRSNKIAHTATLCIHGCILYPLSVVPLQINYFLVRLYSTTAQRPDRFWETANGTVDSSLQYFECIKERALCGALACKKINAAEKRRHKMGNMLRGTQNTIPSPLRRMPTKSCADTGSPHIKTHVKRQKTHFKIYFLYQRPSLCACALRYTSSCYRHGCLLCSAHVAQKREIERKSNAMRATTAAHSALFANAHRHRPRLANANKEQRHCASRYNTRPFARHLHVTICTSPSARQY
eukprot:IDg23629t1